MGKEHIIAIAIAVSGVAGALGSAILPDYLKSTYSPAAVNAVFVACLSLALLSLFVAIAAALWPSETRDLLSGLGPGGRGGSAVVSGNHSSASGGAGGQAGVGRAGGAGGGAKVVGNHSHARGGDGGNALEATIPTKEGTPFLVQLFGLLIVSIVLAYGGLQLKSRAVVPDGPGGRGGSARVYGDYSGGLGGAGGLGGVGPGGPGGDVEVRGDNSLAIGGDGGNAGQWDGRGGQRTTGIGERMGWPTSLWAVGTGGEGGNAPEYNRRLDLLIRIRADYLQLFPGKTNFINAGIDQVPVHFVNMRLEELGERWRVLGLTNEGGYKMPPLPRTP